MKKKQKSQILRCSSRGKRSYNNKEEVKVKEEVIKEEKAEEEKKS
jgi:hypothetical protein